MPATGTNSSPAEALNYWPDDRCAKAFWNQHSLPPYRELLADTVKWLDVEPGERWLDLGCGSGQLSRALWEGSQGELEEVIGLDCAAINEQAYEKLRTNLAAPAERLRFVADDFSAGLSRWADGRFDGVVSGLAIQYATSFEDGRWTTSAYDHVLNESFRVLRPGGRFVFSVNVPKPAWGWVALCSLSETFRARNPLRFLQKAYRIYSYGGWLKREAESGRFHYLPLEKIRQKLIVAGFSTVEHRLSFAGQAYLFRCRKGQKGMKRVAG